MKMSFSDDGFSPRSEAPELSGRSSAVYSPNVDPDVARMEHTLDQWSYELKRNILVGLLSYTCLLSYELNRNILVGLLSYTCFTSLISGATNSSAIFWSVYCVPLTHAFLH